MSLNPPNLSKASLRSRLTRRIAVIVALTALLLSMISVGVIRQLLISNIDSQISYVFGNPDEPVVLDELRVGGLPGGSFIVIAKDGEIHAQIVTDSGFGVPNAEQFKKVLRVECDGRPRNINVGHLGPYRAQCSASTGPQVYVAIPLSSVNGLVANIFLAELVLCLLAVVAAVLVVNRVIGRALSPLGRLAATATQVSQMPLGSGEVSLKVRVPATSDGNEIDRVGYAFNRMLDHVENSLQSRQASESSVRRFVSDASHELRNPLASIRGYAELLNRRSAELDDGSARAVDRIDFESQRMSRLVEDMLLLARLDEGRGIDVEDVDVVEIALNAVSDAQVSDRQHHWLLDLPDPEAGEVVVRGDKFRLQQVVANLLGNARKHTGAGTSVMTKVSVDNGWAVITIADDGPGIDPELLPHIFERFTRADSSRAHNAEGSTGLGLSIVASLVEAHGGKVAVRSTLGKGAEFEIRLPLAGNQVQTEPQSR